MTPESAPAFPGSPADPMPGPRGAVRHAVPRAVRGAARRTAVGRVTRRAALAALAVPGAILLILDIPSTSEPSSSFTRIYAVTGGSQ